MHKAADKTAGSEGASETKKRPAEKSSASAGAKASSAKKPKGKGGIPSE